MPKYLIALLSALLLSQSASATIVRLDFTVGSQPQAPVYLELFDQQAPATVTNFLNYVENAAGDHRYDDTFVHRSLSGFVLQLGGFRFDPAVGSFEGAGVSHIPEDAPVINEFSAERSNVRGTIAMAKTPNQPNSARSEWFFNLSDNSANLDDQEGGFTVFGRVTGTGMETIDEIVALNTETVSAFTDLPVVDYTQGDPVMVANLVTLQRAFIAPPDIDVNDETDAGDALIGETVESSFGIRNVGTGPLIILNKEIIGADAALFTLGDICAKELNPGIGCRESLVFEPVFPMDAVDATIQVSSNDPDNPVVDIPIKASAGYDRDGISDAIENQAPNNGDGNHDGVADAVQAHVASLPNINGQYVTIEVPPGQSLTDISALDNPSPDDTPNAGGSVNLVFKHGFFSFAIEDVPVGATTTATIHLPENGAANNYFMYGILPNSPFLDQWYQFKFNGEVGAEFLGNRVVLHFLDGWFGDNDLTANGRIVDPGGPATISTVSSSSGGGGCALMERNLQATPAFPADIILLITGLLLIQRYRRQLNKRA